VVGDLRRALLIGGGAGRLHGLLPGRRRRRWGIGGTPLAASRGSRLPRVLGLLSPSTFGAGQGLTTCSRARPARQPGRRGR
jgi:hypothetical protein